MSDYEAGRIEAWSRVTSLPLQYSSSTELGFMEEFHPAGRTLLWSIPDLLGKKNHSPSPDVFIGALVESPEPVPSNGKLISLGAMQTGSLKW